MSDPIVTYVEFDDDPIKGAPAKTLFYAEWETPNGPGNGFARGDQEPIPDEVRVALAKIVLGPGYRIATDAPSASETEISELKEKIARIPGQGAHQLWCGLFGETVGWDDALIRKIEPFMIRFAGQIKEDLERPYDSRERERFVTQTRRVLDAQHKSEQLFGALQIARAFIGDELEARREGAFDESNEYLKTPADILARIDAALAQGEA